MSDLVEFQQEVRDFLNEKLTPELRHFGEMYPGYFSPRHVAEKWQAILEEKGWAAPSWPVEYGGTDWTTEQIMLFKKECTLAHAPRPLNSGEGMIGPVLIEFGTEEQKADYLPLIRNGQQRWAQGYSEPGAGSDLAALKTSAVRDGDEYVINGSKIWTSEAHNCDMIFCLVRTSNEGKPKAGISFMIFPLDLPGIEIRPIVTFGGEHEFNEVFFSDVRVPKSGLIGEENGGWGVSNFLLTSERSYSYATTTHDYLNRMRGYVRQMQATGDGRLIEDSVFLKKLAGAEMDLECLDLMEEKTLHLMKTDRVAASALASVNKIKGTSLQQRVTELGVELLEHYAMPKQPILEKPGTLDELIGEPARMTAQGTSHYFADRAMTLAGGTSEILRNIIALRKLGL